MGRDDHHHQRQAVDVFLHADEHLQSFFSVFLHQLRHLTSKVDIIMASQAEQAQILRDVLAQQQKTSSEIGTLQGSVDTLNARIAELEAIVASGGEATPELVEAVAAVKAQAQVVDDQIPDVPTP